MSSFRINQIRPYLLGSVAQAVLDSRLAGRDVIDFSQAVPDFAPPRSILDHLVQSSLRPQNHRYSTSQGVRRLRESIAFWYESHHDVSLDPETEAVAVLGTKEGLVHLLLAVTNQGDSVLIPSPAYPVHLTAISLAGASSVSVPMMFAIENAAEKSYLLTGDCDLFFNSLASAYESVFPQPKWMVVSFPHNPTTAVVELSFFERLLEFAKEKDIYLIHDFAYSTLVFDGFSAPSILQVPGAKERCVEFFSLSKGFGVAGWRTGFLVGNKILVSALRRIKSYIDFGIFQPLQLAVAEMLFGESQHIQHIRNTVAERRNALYLGLTNLGWSVIKPQATMFLWAQPPSGLLNQLNVFTENVELPGSSSIRISHELLEGPGIATCPGAGFGEDGNNYLRFALVEDVNRINLALERLANIF